MALGNKQSFVAICNRKSELATLLVLLVLGVNERTCDIFSYALASFLHLCQSSLGTRITQKNVNHDNHVNKDNSGNRYTKMSSVNGCYMWELVSNLHQATGPREAKMKNRQLLY